jgi:homoserine O-succinyltransferase/O-acetyltransferase
MPVRLQSRRFDHDLPAGASRVPGKQPSQLSEPSREAIRIGLVNNMPEAAFKATENQFLSLLESASEGLSVELSLYVLRGAAVAASNGDHAANRYACVEELWGQSLDGLIVTGAEPMTAALKDEPYWESFVQLLDWARDNTRSSIWSCLAAHAAILHMDGIERRRNHAKHFGVFQCHRESDDGLLKGVAPHFAIPHSRWNGVDARQLEAHGYRVVSRTADAEVDTFTKQEKSLFVFFQGHPEYATDTLLREYRRDIGRYIRRDAGVYPQLPHGYFDRASEQAFSSLRASVSSRSSNELLAGVAAVTDTIKIENTWQPTAVRLYRNWLEYTSGCQDASHPRRKVDASHAACQ